MATKVYMEALSPTMEEGRVIAWLKNEGDEVEEGDVLAEVETDKATMELVARGSGVLRKRFLSEGGTADVGTVIAVVAAPDEDIEGIVQESTEVEQGPTSGVTEEDVASAPQGTGDVAEAAADLARSEHTEADQVERASTGAARPAQAERAADGRVKASPLARRLAADQGLEIGEIQGTGPGGRIVKRDITAALEAAPAPTPEEVPAEPAVAVSAEYEDVPLSQMRKTIARRLTQSLGPVPHFFLTVDVDMTAASAMRERINERFADEGIRVSPNDLIIKAAAMALTRHPWVNAAWTGDAVRQYREVHIGVAVAVEDGLITPVVRNADRKGVSGIAQEVRELAGRARDRKLKPEEYTGSTFSISNLGMYGIEEFTAVINPPEAAILAVGAIVDRVVVEAGEMVVRPRMHLTLSCDHRVVDGATGAQFLQTLQRYLEDPLMMIAEDAGAPPPHHGWRRAGSRATPISPASRSRSPRTSPNPC